MTSNPETETMQARPPVVSGEFDEGAPRFAFGKNWRRFLEDLDDERICGAEIALSEFLRRSSLAGESFLDAGSGSGLMSLAALRLGAGPITSFDFDETSVACTEELRRRSGAGSDDWQVTRGSLLDTEFLASLGQYDIVYCWGVAHHTGAMWEALANLVDLVRPGGRLFVAIYNDQGLSSRIWMRVKRVYVRGGPSVRPPLVALSALALYAPRFFLRILIKVYGFIRHPLRSARGGVGAVAPKPKRPRGMSAWHDLIDWVGGYPFEVARPDEIFTFYRERGFALENLQTCGGGLGCNQFVLRRHSVTGAAVPTGTDQSQP